MKFTESPHTLQLIEENEKLREKIIQNSEQIRNNHTQYWLENTDRYDIKNDDDVIELCLLSMEGHLEADVILRNKFEETYPHLYYTGSRINIETVYNDKLTTIPFPRVAFNAETFKDGIESVYDEIESFFDNMPECLKGKGSIWTSFIFGKSYYEVSSLQNGFYILRTGTGHIKLSAKLFDILEEVANIVK